MVEIGTFLLPTQVPKSTSRDLLCSYFDQYFSLRLHCVLQVIFEMCGDSEIMLQRLQEERDVELLSLFYYTQPLCCSLQHAFRLECSRMDSIAVSYLVNYVPSAQTEVF